MRPAASLKDGMTLAALVAAIVAPGTALGQGGGGPGCTNLPEYNRALGALQGMTSACDMSVEEACRVLAAHGTPAAGCQPAAPRRPDRQNRTRTLHP